MSDFKGYWKNYEDENYVLGSEEYCAQQAWKHQQAKIDELQRKIAFQEKAIKNIKLQFENKQIDCDRSDRKINELQARVDLTLNIITDIKKAGIEMEKTPNVRKVGMVLINFMSGLEIALRGANA